MDQELQRLLLADALEDPTAGTDAFDRPRKVWNAVAGWVFVGVSSNEQLPAYNCFPEAPVTALVAELQVRAERTIEEVLQGVDE